MKIGFKCLGAAILALGLITALTGCRNATASDTPPEKDKTPDEVAVEMTAAHLGTMETVVSAQGTLTAGQGANARVATTVPGRLLQVTVREGDSVRQGQLIAVVDNRPQLAQARSAAAAFTASEAQAQQSSLAVRALSTDQANAVRLARLALSSATLDRDNAIQLAKNAQAAAETDLQKTRTGARPQEIAQSEQAVNQAKATRDRAATEVERVRFLLDKGIAPRRQLDDAQTALAVADSALESARQQANLVRAGARAEDIRAAELRVEQARETLRQAGVTGEAKVAQANAALRQALQSAMQIQVKQQEARGMRELAKQKREDLRAAQATAAYAEIRAPMDGIVTKRNLGRGDMADTTTPIIELTNPRSLNLLANLPAEEGMRLRAGLPVRITAPDAPGQEFGGQVASIGQVDPQTNLLSVRIMVANAQGRLRIGTFAAADIILRTDTHAVLIPKQAVVSREGKPVVFVVAPDNTAHLREVKTGPEHGEDIQITDGLASGEKVVRLGQYEMTDGMKVHEAEPAKDDEKKDGDKKEGTTKEDKADKKDTEKKESETDKKKAKTDGNANGATNKPGSEADKP